MKFVIAGLSFLLSLIASIGPSLVEYFARWITKRTLFLAAYYAAYAALTVSIFTMLNVSISSLSLSAPSGLAAAAGHFLPSNAFHCLNSFLTALALRWIYDYQVKLLDTSLRFV